MSQIVWRMARTPPAFDSIAQGSRQRGFVKPRWGLDARDMVTQGAPLARRPWALECNAVGVKTFSCGATVGGCHAMHAMSCDVMRCHAMSCDVMRFHAIPCGDAFDVHGDGVGDGRISCGTWHVRQRR